MNYEEILTQVIALLQQEHRVAYRVLKRRLELDDALLEDLKDDLIYAKQLALDEEGRVLVWRAAAGASSELAVVEGPGPAEARPAVGEADRSAWVAGGGLRLVHRGL